MFARSARVLIAVLLVGCVAAPSALAADPSGKTTSSSTQAKTSADTTLRLLESISSIRIGANSTVVTIQNGPKTHPIVIDYGAALQTGNLAVNNDGTTSRLERGSSKVPSSLPKGFSLGQIAALLLGLTVVGRVLSIVRQLVPARNR